MCDDNLFVASSDASVTVVAGVDAAVAFGNEVVARDSSLFSFIDESIAIETRLCGTSVCEVTGGRWGLTGRYPGLSGGRISFDGSYGCSRSGNPIVLGHTHWVIQKGGRL